MVRWSDVPQLSEGKWLVLLSGNPQHGQRIDVWNLETKSIKWSHRYSFCCIVPLPGVHTGTRTGAYGIQERFRGNHESAAGDLHAQRTYALYSRNEMRPADP
jgi:hypothetical protein